MSRVIQPGSTIGVLGSGQLGRMFAIAARRMGYRVHVLSPDDDTPTGQIADVEYNASYDDLDTVAQFAGRVDVVTFEFENVPAATIDVVDRYAPVRPAGSVLHTTQDRLREKMFLRNAGLPVTPFRAIRNEADVTAVTTAEFPAVLKTSRWGYDGKGQQRVNQRDGLRAAWSPPEAAILEQFIDFERELSVVAVRHADGTCVVYDPIDNHHEQHILDVSVSPSTAAVAVRRRAEEIARAVLERLDVLGVLCVEYFVTRDDQLLINELAPRPHNSGHLTIDAHATCQFEQQVRAVCGLPLGSPRQFCPAAMANLLGDLWQQGSPDWSAACALPEVKMHLYGKRDPRPGRKMGHLTARAESAPSARARVLDARRRLTQSVALPGLP